MFICLAHLLFVFNFFLMATQKRALKSMITTNEQLEHVEKKTRLHNDNISGLLGFNLNFLKREEVVLGDDIKLTMTIRTEFVDGKTIQINPLEQYIAQVENTSTGHTIKLADNQGNIIQKVFITNDFCNTPCVLEYIYRDGLYFMLRMTHDAPTLCCLKLTEHGIEQLADSEELNYLAKRAHGYLYINHLSDVGLITGILRQDGLNPMLDLTTGREFIHCPITDGAFAKSCLLGYDHNSQHFKLVKFARVDGRLDCEESIVDDSLFLGYHHPYDPKHYTEDVLFFSCFDHYFIVLYKLKPDYKIKSEFIFIDKQTNHANQYNCVAKLINGLTCEVIDKLYYVGYTLKQTPQRICYDDANLKHYCFYTHHLPGGNIFCVNQRDKKFFIPDSSIEFRRLIEPLIFDSNQQDLKVLVLNIGQATGLIDDLVKIIFSYYNNDLLKNGEYMQYAVDPRL